MNRFIIIGLLLSVFSGTFIVPAEAERIRSKQLVELKYNPNGMPYQVLMPKSYLNSRQTKASETDKFQIEFLPAGSLYAKDWDDVAVDWPEDAKEAFLYVAKLWSSFLNIKETITVKAVWCSNMETDVLGHSGHISSYEINGTDYPVALANQMEQQDLDPDDADIYCAFNSSFNWYKGIDGQVPNNQSDLVSVVMHEFCHGLGFVGSMTMTGATASWGSTAGIPLVYDRFAEDRDGHPLIDTQTYPNHSRALAQELTSGKVFFSGPYATGCNQGESVALYAPSVWSEGSSYSHLDDCFWETPNTLMCYCIAQGQATHFPGYVTLGIMKDIGWNIDLDSIDVFLPPVALDATAITSNSFQANWHLTDDAESYVVEVYKVTELNNDPGDIGILPKTPSVQNASETTYSIERIFESDHLTDDNLVVLNLTKATNYEYRVKAYKEDQIVNSNWIKFSTLTSATHNENPETGSCQVYATGGNVLNIHTATIKQSSVSVFDAAGKLVLQDQLSSGENQFILPAKGIYFVRIGRESYRIYVN